MEVSVINFTTEQYFTDLLDNSQFYNEFLTRQANIEMNATSYLNGTTDEDIFDIGASGDATTTAATLSDIQSAFLKNMTDLAHNILKFYTPVLAITGSIGNIISVLVFFCTKLKKLSSSYYLAALGVSDTGILLLFFCQWLNYFNISLYAVDIFCQFFTYLSGLCTLLSSWFVVAFTLERFIAVLYPLKRQTLCTVRRAKSVLLCLVLFGIVHSLPLLVFFAPQTNREGVFCDVYNNYQDHMRYYNYYDTFLSFIAPLTLIVILNSFTTYTVWKLAGIRRTMTTHKRKRGSNGRDSKRHTASLHETNNIANDGDLSEQSLKINSCTHLNGHHSTKQSCPKTNRQRLSNSSQMKVTKMLLIVSTVFVLLNLPSYLLRIRAFLMDSKEVPISIIVMQYLAQSLYMTNFGINFVLYCLTGQNFRKEIIGLFSRKSTRRMEVGTQVTVSEYMPRTGSHFYRKRAVTRNVSWNDTYEMQVMPPVLN